MVFARSLSVMPVNVERWFMEIVNAGMSPYCMHFLPMQKSSGFLDCASMSTANGRARRLAEPESIATQIRPPASFLIWRTSFGGDFLPRQTMSDSFSLPTPSCSTMNSPALAPR